MHSIGFVVCLKIKLTHSRPFHPQEPPRRTLKTGCKLVKKSYLPKWQVNIFFYLPNEKFTSQNSFSQKVMYFYLRNKKHKHLCTQNTYKWNVSPPLIQKTLRHHQIQNQNRRNSPPQSILPHICLNFFTRQSDG